MSDQPYSAEDWRSPLMGKWAEFTVLDTVRVRNPEMRRAVLRNPQNIALCPESAVRRSINEFSNGAVRVL